jgi:peroxiredoxin
VAAVIVAIAATVAVTVGRGRDDTTTGSTPAARAVPIARVDTNTGARFAIPAGKPTVLYFMTTEACAGCELGAQALETARQRAGGTVAVLGIEMVPGTPASALDTFARDLQLGYPITVDNDGRLALRYGGTDLSSAVVLDADGQRVAGPLDATDSDALDAALRTAAN